MSRGILEVNDMRKRYGKTAALQGVTLSVASGELFGLLGPNGAGKTTLLSIVSGLLDADGGEVLLDGRPFRRADRDLRRLVGIGTQDLAVYPDLTARENVLFFGKLYGLGGDALNHRMEMLLTAVGLWDRADHRAGTFSGGMKRRLNLAVAVIHSPKLLLLDEPTTGVDPQSRNLIFEIVRKLNAEGMSVIYTSHYMEEVQALCPRIAIMDKGQVIACDTIGHLLKLRPSELRLKVDPVPPGFEEQLQGLDGVTAVHKLPDGVQLSAAALGPLLPKIATLCATAGVTPTAMETSESTLEKVFLHLTGHALRD
ncbi:ABC transporter ATP-binding protein [Limnoglobus roseus]|uniref:ABC transporter ATP-binding protein n=1 Tax=Limnoglobus roseus TaxID=2598579 RepID=A0A5C1AMI3_9BACT|nr:ABC transporter ATP-binding protein [Limnoglobus roseus]QEL19795.1 ABC transporter ATP-binding protein [Limnoglobus roseus]